MVKLDEFALENVVGGDCTVSEAAESFVKGMEKPFRHLDKYDDIYSWSPVGSVVTMSAALAASVILHEIVISTCTKIKNKLKQY